MADAGDQGKLAKQNGPVPDVAGGDTPKPPTGAGAGAGGDDKVAVADANTPAAALAVAVVSLATAAAAAAAKDVHTGSAGSGDRSAAQIATNDMNEHVPASPSEHKSPHPPARVVDFATTAAPGPAAVVKSQAVAPALAATDTRTGPDAVPPAVVVNAMDVAAAAHSRDGPTQVMLLSGSDKSEAGYVFHSTSHLNRYANPTGVCYWTDPKTSDPVLIVADNDNHCIRSVTTTGVSQWLTGMDRGHRDNTKVDSNSRQQRGGQVMARLDNPYGVTVDPYDKAVLFTDRYAVRRLAQGVVSTLAGSATKGQADGTGNKAQFTRPRGLLCTSDGRTLYVCDFDCIRALDMRSKRVTTVVGKRRRPHNTDGVGNAASIRHPRFLAFAPGTADAIVYVTAHRAIRRVDLRSDEVTSVLLDSPWIDPCGLVVAPNGKLIVSSNSISDHTAADGLFVVDPLTGYTERLAGTGMPGGPGDGPWGSVFFNGARGLALGGRFLKDQGVRNAAGALMFPGVGVDPNTPATVVRLDEHYQLFVCDSRNNVIRTVRLPEHLRDVVSGAILPNDSKYASAPALTAAHAIGQIAPAGAVALALRAGTDRKARAKRASARKRGADDDRDRDDNGSCDDDDDDDSASGGSSDTDDEKGRAQRRRRNRNRTGRLPVQPQYTQPQSSQAQTQQPQSQPQGAVQSYPSYAQPTRVAVPHAYRDGPRPHARDRHAHGHGRHGDRTGRGDSSDDGDARGGGGRRNGQRDDGWWTAEDIADEERTVQVLTSRWAQLSPRTPSGWEFDGMPHSAPGCRGVPACARGVCRYCDARAEHILALEQAWQRTAAALAAANRAGNHDRAAAARAIADWHDELHKHLLRRVPGTRFVTGDGRVVTHAVDWRDHPDADVEHAAEVVDSWWHRAVRWTSLLCGCAAICGDSDYHGARCAGVWRGNYGVRCEELGDTRCGAVLTFGALCTRCCHALQRRYPNTYACKLHKLATTPDPQPNVTKPRPYAQSSYAAAGPPMSQPHHHHHHQQQHRLNHSGPEMAAFPPPQQTAAAPPGGALANGGSGAVTASANSTTASASASASGSATDSQRQRDSPSVSGSDTPPARHATDGAARSGDRGVAVSGGAMPPMVAPDALNANFPDATLEDMPAHLLPASTASLAAAASPPAAAAGTGTGSANSAAGAGAAGAGARTGVGGAAATDGVLRATSVELQWSPPHVHRSGHHNAQRHAQSSSSSRALPVPPPQPSRRLQHAHGRVSWDAALSTLPRGAVVMSTDHFRALEHSIQMQFHRLSVARRDALRRTYTSVEDIVRHRWEECL